MIDNMAKVINAENARLHFTISVEQLMVKMIPVDVLIERLQKLESVISHNTSLYSIIDEILHEFDIMPQSDKGDESKLAEKYEIINTIAHKEGGMLELLIGKMIISDNDKLPSVPHIHEKDSERKLDIYTGYFTDGTHLSKKDFIELWNNPEFIKKISKNQNAITTKK